MTTPARTIATVFALACTLALGACATRAPSFEVVNASVVERTEDGVVIDFTLAGANPNPDELPLRVIRYTLELDGRTVFTGERSAEATLRRRGVQTITVPAAIAIADLDDPDDTTRVRAYRLSGAVRYLAAGTIPQLLFDLGASRPSVGFADTGEITLAARRGE
ncbi:MAG: hypothetical protein EA379_00435 [Phycisphaerales bacterium]|nr:MAG: hypothetical protein EA379_00435 [Phycisphaerales bacterium]